MYISNFANCKGYEQNLNFEGKEKSCNPPTYKSQTYFPMQIEKRQGIIYFYLAILPVLYGKLLMYDWIAHVNDKSISYPHFQ